MHEAAKLTYTGFELSCHLPHALLLKSRGISSSAPPWGTASEPVSTPSIHL